MRRGSSTTKRDGPVWYRTPILWLVESPFGNLVAELSILIYLTCLIAFYALDDSSLSILEAVALVAPTAGFLFYLIKCFGPPSKWWAPYFGHTIRVNRERVYEQESRGLSSEVQEEIFQWVVTSSGRYWYRHNPYSYKFLRRRDAMLFKLAWG